MRRSWLSASHLAGVDFLKDILPLKIGFFQCPTYTFKNRLEQISELLEDVSHRLRYNFASLPTLIRVGNGFLKPASVIEVLIPLVDIKLLQPSFFLCSTLQRRPLGFGEVAIPLKVMHAFMA